MTVEDKLKILTDAARYDVACTSSGTERAGVKGMLGNTTAMGICHSFAADGRCVSLLKVLMTNVCVYDCQYCVNRRSNDIPRAAFTPDELAELTIQFYRRNYIEGLFLSSAVIQNADYTTELLWKTLWLVRNQYKFNGYIHVKAIPGANENLIEQVGMLADRMSVNIELPSEPSLNLLAPDKPKSSILLPMKNIRNRITQAKNELVVYRHAPKFVPAGQSTQLIVGATPESDAQIVRLAQGFYKKYGLKRVFYSAYTPVARANKILPVTNPPMLREHRLYQADWLLRFYGFTAEEILSDGDNLDLNMDPKCRWAIQNMQLFPVEINAAAYEEILRVPGIGVRSAQKIVKARKTQKLTFESLQKMRVSLKRARYFITCGGHAFSPGLSQKLNEEILTRKLGENKIGEAWEQLSLLEPSREDFVKCITGEI